MKIYLKWPIINRMGTFSSLTKVVSDSRKMFKVQKPVHVTDSATAQAPQKQPTLMRSVVCYTPINASETVSLLLKPGPKCTIAKKSQCAVIPKNAIIDMVEYFGLGLQTKGAFNISLGQLNSGQLFPLIEGGTPEIANEKIGGCRQFLAHAVNGANVKNLVIYDGYVNVTLEQPILSGGLQVVIHYHMKPE